ncbi:MAG: alpha-amylase family glycosyl hydrolase [Bacteroidota bacterium]
MRSIIFSLLIFILPTFLFAQTYSVTFRVDMSQETISPNGVHVAGDFQSEAGFGGDWNPGVTTLKDGDGDKVYEATVSLPKGTYFFKFVNGNNWGEKPELPTNACAVSDGGGNNNRVFHVDEAAVQLDIIPFDSCATPQLAADPLPWWNDAVFYEIFVRSFYDSDGDGIGDFQGIIEKLDYLNDGNSNTTTDLGVTGLWLMPMMESPSYHGYDVTDYYKTEPDYGSMADFEELLDSCHARGIKVVIDFVMNHSSSQHDWFVQSRNSQNNYRDWYVWRNSNPGFDGPWGQQVWHPHGGNYYYGIFWGGMPDLNYSHPPVKEEMFNISEFWLDKGVDGFRLDAIKYLDEDGNVLENTPENFQLLEEFNQVYKTAAPNAFTVGEVWSNTTSVIPYARSNRLDVCFEFQLAERMIAAAANRDISGLMAEIQSVNYAYENQQFASFLTNHDQDRIFNRLGRDEEKMKLAASLYLTLPGVPFLYYGEEVGMVGTGAHENIRRPMQWSSAAHAGFSTVNPWQGVGSNFQSNNVATFDAQPSSMLNHYRRLIALRNKFSPLRRGEFEVVGNDGNQLLSYARVEEEEAVIVVSNFSTQSQNGFALSMGESKLAPGQYEVGELYGESYIGTLTVNSDGSFSTWVANGQSIGGSETLLFFLSKTQTVDLEEIEGSGFTYYPNPAKSYFVIDSHQPGEFRFDLLSVDGKVIQRGQLQAGPNRIDLDTISNGIYYIRIQTLEGVTSKKIVVQK